MITIYALPEYINEIKDVISKKERLHELVSVVDMLANKPSPEWLSIQVDKRRIMNFMDWPSSVPPYLLPRLLPYSGDMLMAMIAIRLHNQSWLSELNVDQGLLEDAQNIYCFHNGYQLKLPESVDWRSSLNRATVMHYGITGIQVHISDVRQAYETAVEKATDELEKGYSLIALATFLSDIRADEEAEKLALKALNYDLPEIGHIRAKTLLNQLWMGKVKVPYDQELLFKIKSNMQACVDFYAQQKRKAEEALLLMDGASIAGIEGKYTESLQYITRAIQLFQEEELSDLAFEAQLGKAKLLFNWSQSGNPQFYAAGLKEYQNLLKKYADMPPAIKADISHDLAVIYTEMPKDESKEGIWMGVANQAFQEALSYYTKEAFPYEYAMISNNMGNALSTMQFSTGELDLHKALECYEEALSVRDHSMPYERAITLLNYLQTSWYLKDEEDGIDIDRLEDMKAKANEISSLVNDKEMVERASEHIAALQDLQNQYSKDHA